MARLIKLAMLLLLSSTSCAVKAPAPACAPAAPQPKPLPAPYSPPSDMLLHNWNRLAKAGNYWAKRYAQGLNDLKAQKELDKAYQRLRQTEGWGRRVYELEQ